jgi:hypothetical protein
MVIVEITIAFIFLLSIGFAVRDSNVIELVLLRLQNIWLFFQIGSILIFQYANADHGFPIIVKSIQNI